jgi:Zn-dependent peptidase ImmA (M78 family)
MQELYDLAEAENIKVVEEYLPGKIRGFYFRKGKAKLICLDRKLHYIEKRCVFAEELGHHFTSYGNIFSLSRSDKFQSENEYLAKKWACKFLIPDSFIKNQSKYGYLHVSLFDAAEEIEVTEKFLEFRLNLWINEI